MKWTVLYSMSDNHFRNQLQEELLAVNLQGISDMESDTFDFCNYGLTDDSFLELLPHLIGEVKIL